MILPDWMIVAWASNGGITPFEMNNINPASIDLRVGNLWRDYHNKNAVFSANQVMLYPRTAFTDTFNLLAKVTKVPRMMTAVLAMTMESISISNGIAGMVKLKSSCIREGLGYPIADWIDPGYSGKLTLMLTAHSKFRLVSGMRIVQLVLEEMEECDRPYNFTGHYMNQEVPTLSWRNNGRTR